ncbi:hypothetical protein T484DRAFT_1767772 [Baffinella frigidus]|nr:hypothetical protein T484DRAFT_1767772 [Cryptophyta sp. CCMP2293]
MDLFESNCKRMAKLLSQTPGVAMRPHVKAHKCPDLAAIQLQISNENGVKCPGVCAQTMREAEVMVHGGVSDVLLTNQVVGEGKITRLVKLAGEAAARGGRVAVLVDSVANAQDISSAAVEEGLVIPVFIEVEAGQGRCGVSPGGADLVALARAVSGAGGVELAGVHCYNGGLQHVRDPEERRALVFQQVVTGSAEKAVAALTDAGLWKQGMPVTGGGTGTFMCEASSGIFTEVQPGSYVFMDADYNQNIWPKGARTSSSSLDPSPSKDPPSDSSKEEGASSFAKGVGTCSAESAEEEGVSPFAQSLHLLATVSLTPNR